MACSLCVGAMPDGEWCRACGEGRPAGRVPEPPRPGLAEAVRVAEGKRLTGGEIEQSISFLNRAASALRGR
jgi:hypothetical protein